MTDRALLRHLAWLQKRRKEKAKRDREDFVSAVHAYFENDLEEIDVANERPDSDSDSSFADSPVTDRPV